MIQHLLILTGTSSRAEAQSIADAAVEQRLAAAEEWLCLLKTSAELYAEVERLIQSLHSYELPGILAIPIAAGSERYLEWYAQQLRCGG
jgi:periplasmic divalent cation tolerance protein